MTGRCPRGRRENVRGLAGNVLQGWRFWRLGSFAKGSLVPHWFELAPDSWTGLNLGGEGNFLLTGRNLVNVQPHGPYRESDNQALDSKP